MVGRVGIIKVFSVWQPLIRQEERINSGMFPLLLSRSSCCWCLAVRSLLAGGAASRPCRAAFFTPHEAPRCEAQLSQPWAGRRRGARALSGGPAAPGTAARRSLLALASAGAARDRGSGWCVAPRMAAPPPRWEACPRP